MWQPETSFAQYLLLLAMVIALTLVSLNNRKMSPSTVRRLANEYEGFADRCNLMIGAINDELDELGERCFLSEADKEKALELLNRYQTLHDELFDCNDKIGFYLQKRNYRQYNRYKKRAEAILRSFKETLHALEDLEAHTVSKEEWEYQQRVHQSEQFYERYGTYYHESESYENDEETAYEDAYNYTQQDESDKTNNNNHRKKQGETADSFFGDCQTKAELDKKYRKLAKVYHPDMPGGDKVTFQKLRDEYERKKGML